MITPVLDRVLGNSRACFTCVISSVPIPVYNCILSASGLFGLVRGPVQGFLALLPVRHEDTQGAAVGDVKSPSSLIHRASVFSAKRSFPLNRVRMHATCARIAHARAQFKYLMITVPVDTILQISNLQLFWQKMQCHFVLF